LKTGAIPWMLIQNGGRKFERRTDVKFIAFSVGCLWQATAGHGKVSPDFLFLCRRKTANLIDK